jgi:hypothetical protein
VFFYENTTKIAAFGPDQNQFLYQSGPCLSGGSNVVWAAVKDTARRRVTRTEMKKIVVPCITSVSKTQQFVHELKIFPNPANSGKITIEGARAGAEFQIFDLAGKSVLQGNLNVEEINIRSLNKGTYLVRIIGSEENSPLKMMVY